MSSAPTLRVLLVHNRYKQTGGEDTVFGNEAALLREGGHLVEAYVRSNDELDAMRPIGAAVDTVWSTRTRRDVGTLIRSFEPDIVHCHNTFPVVSPSVYAAAADCGVPVVQTLHNFRLGCLNAMMLRNGQPCTDCVGRLPWRGVVRRCYQGGLPQSAVAATMLTAHRLFGTYTGKVQAYIALTEFAKQMFVRIGLPADRIHVKPNFVEVAPTEGPEFRTGALFVGRLSREKGIDVLAEVARRVPDVAIRVVGDGPDADRLNGLSNVTLLGRLCPARVFEQMRSALCLVVPSTWFEGFPMVIAEAYANGLPAVASRLGSLGELVVDDQTGHLCVPGDAADFARTITRLAADPVHAARLSHGARAYSIERLGRRRNLARLEQIYRATRPGHSPSDAATHSS